MEFDIDIKNGLHGHVEISDYSKEYGQYYSETVEIYTDPNKFKYSLSNSLNVIIKVDSDKATLMDVLLDEHVVNEETGEFENEKLAFDVNKDGYYTVTHFVLPNEQWVSDLIALEYKSLIAENNYKVIYYIKDKKIVKQTVTVFNKEVTYGDIEEVTVKELLERNVEGTTILKCRIDIFCTSYLLECYINKCRELFNKSMSGCNSNCRPTDLTDLSYARDFIWMTLNVIDYLIEYKQYLEAQRVLEKINYCGGFCQNVEQKHGVSCGCHSRPVGCGCGQS